MSEVIKKGGPIYVSSFMREQALENRVKELETAVKDLELERARAEVAMTECIKYAKLYGYEQAKNNRLRAAIERAPHGMGCTSLQDSVPRDKYGSPELCNCWKSAALREAARGK